MNRIAVITPYHREPLEMLAQCHQSVLAQRVPADHFMVADGFPRTEVAGWDVRHATLPGSHGAGGAIARGVGGALADAQRYDFIAYLDADNWWQPDHLSSLMELHQSSRAPVCTSMRTFHATDGTQMSITEPEEDRLHHVDTNCILLQRRAFEVLPIWSRMPAPLNAISDRIFVAAIRKNRLPMASTRQRTVAYRTQYESHYRSAGLPPPPGFKNVDVLKPAWAWMHTKEGVDACFHILGFWPPTYL